MCAGPKHNSSRTCVSGCVCRAIRVLQGVLGLLRLETGTESLTEAEFALVFLVLLVATNLKSPTGKDSD